jgi:hypothetical protein
MTTTDQTARDAAALAVRTQLGLPENRTLWTYEQRRSYIAALSTYVQSRPEQFSDQTLLNAEYAAKKPAQALEDDSFQWGDFAAETAKPLTDAAQSVGQGALTTLNLTRWLMPAAAVATVLILLTGLARRSGATK